MPPWVMCPWTAPHLPRPASQMRTRMILPTSEGGGWVPAQATDKDSGEAPQEPEPRLGLHQGTQEMLLGAHHLASALLQPCPEPALSPLLVTRDGGPPHSNPSLLKSSPAQDVQIGLSSRNHRSLRQQLRPPAPPPPRPTGPPPKGPRPIRPFPPPTRHASPRGPARQHRLHPSHEAPPTRLHPVRPSSPPARHASPRGPARQGPPGPSGSRTWPPGPQTWEGLFFKIVYFKT